MPLLKLTGEASQKYTFVAPSILHGRHAQVGADNEIVTVTVAAQVGQRTAMTYLLWSYDEAPTGGQITITDDEVTITLFVTDAGPGFIPLESVAFAENAAVVATLTSGGAAIAGSLALLGVRSI